MGLLALASLATPGCGQSGPGSGAPGGTASAGERAPEAAIPPEKALFGSSKPVLADLPALKLVPKNVSAVLAVLDPAGALAKLSALKGFSEAKEPLAREIDAAAKELTKDLPDLAQLAQSGVDLARPIGMLWTDPDLHTGAIFAAVSDEAAMKRWLEDRARQSGGKRELVTAGDAAVLRAKKDVTRAVVLRKGHVFWVRTRDRHDLDPARVIQAADALAQTAEGDSLAADPAFSKALGALAFGDQAALYASPGRIAEGLVTARRRELESAQKALEEAQAALAKAEEKKKKRAIDEAKGDVESAEHRKRRAEGEVKAVEVAALVKDELPALAAGVELGDREIKLKAFLALAKPGAVKLLAPREEPVTVFDPALGEGTAASFAVDPRLLDLLRRQLAARSIYRDGLPLDRARAELRVLGVDTGEIDPLLDGEVSAATHAQKAPAAGAAPSGEAAASAAPSGGAAAPPEREGFTVIWRLSDPARAKAVLEEAWKKVDGTERAAKIGAARLGEGSFEVRGRPGELPVRFLVSGRALVVSTWTAPETLVDGKAHPTWMAASEHPTLKQLAGIEGPSAIVAFDGGAWRERRGLDRFFDGDLGALGSFGMVGLFGGGDAKKTKELREQREKLQKELRELERELRRHEDATWAAFTARLGKTVLYAKPGEGGIFVYGGSFTQEPSLSALAEAGIDAWLSAGPRWEKWGAMTELKKKIRSIDDRLEEESRKAMSELVGGVLQGLGSSDGALGGRAGGFAGGWTDDVGSVIGTLGSDRLGGAGRGGGAGTIGAGKGRPAATSAGGNAPKDPKAP